MRKLAFGMAILLAASASAAYQPKRSWVQLAAITYQNTIPYYDDGSGTVMYSKIGYYDMLIGPGGTLYTQFKLHNPNGAVINYGRASTIYPPDNFSDMPWIDSWAASKGITSPYDFIYRANTNMTIHTLDKDGVPYDVATTAGNYTKFFFWNTYRYHFDVRGAHALAFTVERMRRVIGTDEGMMEDEALEANNGQGKGAIPSSQPLPASAITQGSYISWGWPGGMTEQQITDSVSRYLTGYFYPRLSDSLYVMGDKWLFKNYAAYFYMTDSQSRFEPGLPLQNWNATYVPNDQERQNYVGRKNINLLLGEYSGLHCHTYTRQWQYLGYMQQLVDSGCKVVFWSGALYTGYPYNWNILDYGKERAFRERYAYYLQAAHPTLTWWLNCSNQAQTTMFGYDTIQQRGIVEYNIGQPVGHFVDSTTPPFHYYCKTKRYYTNAVVLWCGLNAGPWAYNLAADTARFHCTGFYPVQDNGALGATKVLSVTLQSVDGQLMVPDNAAPQTTNISIGTPSPVTEGGTLAFPVTRTWSTGAVTINYMTQDGTALAPGDYIPQASGQLTIPDGSTSGTIFVQTNADAVLEPMETIAVLLTSASAGTFVTASAIGNVNDGTPPPANANEKRFKGRKS